MMLLEQLEIYSIIYYNYFRQSININVSKKDLLKSGNLTARTHKTRPHTSYRKIKMTNVIVITIYKFTTLS